MDLAYLSRIFAVPNHERADQPEKQHRKVRRYDNLLDLIETQDKRSELNYNPHQEEL
jgi:hypothetical protein